MKAEELRLGNFVVHKNGKQLQMDRRLFYALYNEYNGYGEEFLNPIPLTEEWLVKFGFEKDSFRDSKWFKFKNITIHIGIDDKFYFTMDDSEIEIQHVHQLQNLYYALTNQELTNKTP